MSGSYFAASVFWQGHSHLDFDRRQIRKAMRKIGTDVRKEGRRLVARQSIAISIKNYGAFSALNYSWVSSGAGEMPNKRSGLLQKSINFRVSKPGLLVSIRPDKVEGMKDFYPAFLNYGVKRKRGSGWRIAPRANYMEEALNNRKTAARETLSDALQNALIARK